MKNPLCQVQKALSYSTHWGFHFSNWDSWQCGSSQSLVEPFAMLPVALPPPTSSLRLSNLFSWPVPTSPLICFLQLLLEPLLTVSRIWLLLLWLWKRCSVWTEVDIILFSPAKVQKTQILKYMPKCVIYRRYFFPLSFVMNSIGFLQLTFGEGRFWGFYSWNISFTPI